MLLTMINHEFICGLYILAKSLKIQSNNILGTMKSWNAQDLTRL